MTHKEKFDILTMRYFIPRKNKPKGRITKHDEQAMADFSSRGLKPTSESDGFKLLLWGKTYRDEQITSYRRDIRLGLFTKHEIIQGLPPKFRE